MRGWKEALVQSTAKIRDAVLAIDRSHIQIALVVDEKKSLVGTVTDGDVRRAILKGKSLDGPVCEIMNQNPTVGTANDSQQHLLAVMQKKLHRCIPIVDDKHHVIRVALLNELIQPVERDNVVVIMAGGFGSRLSPLTNECPKPLLKVGTKPILEIILENYKDYGFRRFYISVNYKGDMVKEYFGDGSRWGISIQYLEEDKKLGTAGPLSLLPDTLVDPIFVMNGDLITKLNFQQLLDFHIEHGAKATMCVREYDVQVPYGVVNIEDYRILDIDEKPVHRFFVNAGIYVFDPGVLKYVPKYKYYDMPDLFQRLIDLGTETLVFPIREYWIDVGRIEDFKRANGDYNQLSQLSE